MFFFFFFFKYVSFFLRVLFQFFLFCELLGTDYIYMNSAVYRNGTSFVESLFEKFGKIIRMHNVNTYCDGEDEYKDSFLSRLWAWRTQGYFRCSKRRQKPSRGHFETGELQYKVCFFKSKYDAWSLYLCLSHAYHSHLWRKRLNFMLWGFSKHTCASLCRLLKWYDVQDPPKTHVFHFVIFLLRILSASLWWCRSLEVRGWWGGENRVWRKFELYVLYVSHCRTVPIPQPRALATLLPLCPQHLLLRNTMRRRCHWALERCQNTLSPEVSSFLLRKHVLVWVSFHCS